MSAISPLIPIRMRVRMTALFMPRRNRNCLHMQVGWLHEMPERDPAGSIARETLIKLQNQCFPSFKPPQRFPIFMHRTTISHFSSLALPQPVYIKKGPAAERVLLDKLSCIQAEEGNRMKYIVL